MMWNDALVMLGNDRVNEAYKLILSQHDDLYLIRLMTRTGVCYDKLEQSVAEELKRRVRQIDKTDFIGDLVHQFIREDTGSRGGSRYNNRGQDEMESTRRYDNPQIPANKYMRIEENAQTPLHYHPSNSKHMNTEERRPLTHMSSSHTQSFQSFGRPVPPQSELMKHYRNDDEIYDSNIIHDDVYEEENRSRQEMERLKQEAAQVYEMLRRQV